MASLGALLVLWESPRFQQEVLTAMGEPLDQVSHQLIRHLGFRGPSRPSYLADEVGTGRSNMSKILNRLEAEHLVERVPDPRDSRATLVQLTAAGVQASRHIYDLGDRLASEVLSTWSEAEIESYTHLTQRFARDAISAASRMRERGLMPAQAQRRQP